MLNYDPVLNSLVLIILVPVTHMTDMKLTSTGKEEKHLEGEGRGGCMQTLASLLKAEGGQHFLNNKIPICLAHILYGLMFYMSYMQR